MPPRGNQYLEARDSWIPEHGYVLSITAARWEELETDLTVQSTCSRAIPKIPVAMRRRCMLSFISVNKGFLTHVGRSVVFYPAESGKDNLDIRNVTEFETPVRVTAIKAELKGKQAWRAKQALDGDYASVAAFALIKEALREVDAKAFGIAEGLVDRRPPPPDATPSIAKTNWAYQRDAVVTSLKIKALTAQIGALECGIVAEAKRDKDMQRLDTIPGIGAITAASIKALVPDPHGFKSGRHFAAWLGLTPKKHSSGGKERLGGISKMGNPMLRTLLVLGATSVMWRARGNAKAP